MSRLDRQIKHITSGHVNKENKSRNNHHYKWISSSSSSQADCPIQLICFGHFDVSICFKTKPEL